VCFAVDHSIALADDRLSDGLGQMNANQVFYWRKKYREGRLGESSSGKLLPVTLADDSVRKSGRVGYAPAPSAGWMEIKLIVPTGRDF